MKQIVNLSTEILKVHPRNQEFFDDISGENYEQFKKSVKEDGIITPVIVSPDMTLIAGHQRLRACKDLNIKILPVIINDDLTDEESKLRYLIASNFGRIKNDPMKMRKAIKEYVDLVGYDHGGARVQDALLKPTQEQIAKELGISIDELKRVLTIERSLHPSLREALDKGFISKTAALTICSQLEQEDQIHILDMLTVKLKDNAEINSNKKSSASNKEIEQWIAEARLWKEKHDQVVEKNTELLTKVQEIDELKIQLKKEQQKTAKPDETEIKKLEEKIRIANEQKERIDNERLEYQQKYRDSLEKLKTEQDKVSMFMGQNTNFQLITNTSKITLQMMNFLKEMSQYEYLAEAFNEIPDATRKEYVRSVYGIYKWARNFLNDVRHDDVLGIDKDIIEIIDYKEEN